MTVHLTGMKALEDVCLTSCGCGVKEHYVEVAVIVAAVGVKASLKLSVILMAVTETGELRPSWLKYKQRGRCTACHGNHIISSPTYWRALSCSYSDSTTAVVEYSSSSSLARVATTLLLGNILDARQRINIDVFIVLL